MTWPPHDNAESHTARLTVGTVYDVDQKYCMPPYGQHLALTDTVFGANKEDTGRQNFAFEGRVKSVCQWLMAACLVVFAFGIPKIIDE